jgi:hypothetical protein
MDIGRAGRAFLNMASRSNVKQRPWKRKGRDMSRWDYGGIMISIPLETGLSKVFGIGRKLDLPMYIYNVL